MATTQASQFYRNYFQALVILLIIVIFVILTMVFVVLYQIYNRPLPEFSAFTPNNQKMVLTSFNEPNLLPSTLLRWGSKGAVASYSFDFVNYKAQMMEAALYFTAAGWADYQSSLSSLIDQIIQKQLFVNGVVSGDPIISNQGPLPGRGYVWRLQIPFLVTYQTAEALKKQRFLVSMTVVKIPTNIDPTGIGVDQFVMRQE